MIVALQVFVSSRLNQLTRTTGPKTTNELDLRNPLPHGTIPRFQLKAALPPQRSGEIEPNPDARSLILPTETPQRLW